jgi:hypothetical protein
LQLHPCTQQRQVMLSRQRGSSPLLADGRVIKVIPGSSCSSAKPYQERQGCAERCCSLCNVMWVDGVKPQSLATVTRSVEVRQAILKLRVHCRREYPWCGNAERTLSFLKYIDSYHKVITNNEQGWFVLSSEGLMEPRLSLK